MSDHLDDLFAVALVKITPEQKDAMRAWMRANYIVITKDFQRQWRDEARAQKEAVKAAALTLPDYHGAITQCQAKATDDSNSRWITHSRCQKRPTKVRRIEERHGSYRGDGYLAVCGTHARAQGIGRWVKTDNWQDKHKPATADERVEDEYRA